MELHEKAEQVARRMRLGKDEITNELGKLSFVRQYLTWLGEDGKYHKVPAAGGGHMEQAFQDIAQRFSTPAFKRKTENERRLVRDACFLAIKQEAGYQQIRSMLKHIGQNPTKVSEKLRSRKPAKKASHETHRTTAKVDHIDTKKDPLRALARTANPTTNDGFEDLVEAVNDKDSGSILLDAVDEVEAEEKEAKRQQLPLQRIERAIADLKQVTLADDVEDLDAIAKALGRLSDELDRLSRRVEKLRSHK